jgi:hypothetical protein
MKLVETERKGLRSEEGREEVGGREIARVSISRLGRLSKHARRELDRVDDPELADAEAA